MLSDFKNNVRTHVYKDGCVFRTDKINKIALFVFHLTSFCI